MSTPRFSIYPAAFAYAGPTVLNLRQIDDQGLTPNSQKTIVTPGGALDTGAVIQNFADPMKRFTTRDLTAILGAVSPTLGLYCSGGSTLRFQKRTQGGTFATGGSHVTATSTLGFLKIDGIRASQDDQQGAVAACSYQALYDGTNAPLVAANSVDFDAVNAPAFNSQFFMGPVYLGSSEIPGAVETMCDFGIGFRTVRSAGFVYPDDGSIASRNPTMIFRVLDMTQAYTLSAMFGSAFGSAIKIYYRKGVSGGSRVADATTSHCKVTASTGDATIQEISVSGANDAILAVVVTLTGTIAVSVASAIP